MNNLTNQQSGITLKERKGKKKLKAKGPVA